jgi:hypothetical protein
LLYAGLALLLAAVVALAGLGYYVTIRDGMT